LRHKYKPSAQNIQTYATIILFYTIFLPPKIKSPFIKDLSAKLFIFNKKLLFIIQ